MLTENELHQYADILLWALDTARSGKFKKGDLILLRYDRPAIPLAEILYEKLLKMGRNPVQRMTFTHAMEKSFYSFSSNSQLTFQTPGDEALFKQANGSIYLYAPESITHLSDIDPARIGKAAIARKYLRDILDKRDEEGLFGWTLCLFPTKELACQAKLSLKAYENQVRLACFLDHADPVSQWKQVLSQTREIKKWLNSLKIKVLHIESGAIDLKITPGEKRRWIGISGHNIPSFEIFLSPDWRGTTGVYFADQPSFRSGNYIKDIRIEFKKGVAIKAEAKEGDTFLKKQLAMDDGARKIGEFSLTDRRFSKINKFMANTLYDENFGGRFGNCHVALGSSYSDTYDGDPSTLTTESKKELGLNDSALHWDIVNTQKKRVTAHLFSGKHVTIYENGEFAY